MCLLSESVDPLNNVIVNKGKPISDDQFTLLYELDTLQINDNICIGFVIKYLDISN